MHMNNYLERRSPDRGDTLLHELRVHQKELEAQNEELQRTQIELDQTRARYFDLYDLAPVGYFTLSDTQTILEANFTAANLLGLTVNALVSSPIRNFILPEDQDIYYSHRLKLAETGLPQTCELRLKKKDSSPFWAQLMATVRKDAKGSIVHRLVVSNIDERRLAKDRLRVSDSALNAITQGVLITTPNMLAVWANPALLAMTGYTKTELVGQKCMIFSGPQTGEETISSFYESIAQKREFSGETFNYRKDGSGFWNELNVSPIYDPEGNLTHFISINTDISERKNFDQTLQLKNIELQAATNIAVKANMAKSDFLSSMSHELRSPLNAIVGFAQLLETSTPTPTALQLRNIDRILAGGWYLLKLVNEILDLAQIESGKLALPLQPVAMGPLLLECQQLIEAQAEKHGIQVQFPDLVQSFWVIADPVRLKQVMVNLLSNAIKYNRADGMVEVRLQTGAGGVLRISVKDTGEGLTPDKLAHLFESFNRLGRESGITEGTGIGLVVSKKLTELMGGTIGVQSNIGTGSEFWIELKSAKSQATELSPANRSLPAIPVQVVDEAPCCSVLYVEDNKANVDLVEQILARRSNLQLYSASDGPQGIAMARQHRPHVILMDIHLPGMSGLEALHILHQDPDTRNIPVIAVSANAMPLDVVNGLSAGFFRYLTKPFKIDAFLEALDLALAMADANLILQG
jgi:PAS domain S-box-containing protein